MSELLDNARKRKDLLKHMILELHEGRAPDAVRPQLVRLLGQVPYGDVVEIEQELIADGLPMSEVLRLCDVHHAAMQGAISQEGAKTAPTGHPAHTFQGENKALGWELQGLTALYGELEAAPDAAGAAGLLAKARVHFNALMDVDKHYRRKEYLLFPFLEKHGISGPPTVMWGKHDETRKLLAAAFAALDAVPGSTGVDGIGRALAVLKPASDAVQSMIDKEEQILLPMCLDTLTDAEWWEVARGSAEIGFCLFDPTDAWRPAGADSIAADVGESARVQLPSGTFSLPELTAVLNAIPFDLTFVDRDDTVRFFTQGTERIFARTRAIIGRKVQFCHPPSSVHVVERILGAFRANEQQRAAFWLELKGRFVHIEYLALRGEKGEYLGCLEVSQDLTEKRALTGQQRLLSWGAETGGAMTEQKPETAAVCPECHDEVAAVAQPVARPAWVKVPPDRSLDARPVIAAGAHPLEKVMQDLATLGAGVVYELITPFVPAPLIEIACGKGFEAWSAPIEGGVVRTYFIREG